jgi:hypothetical protein
MQKGRKLDDPLFERVSSAVALGCVQPFLTMVLNPLRCGEERMGIVYPTHIAKGPRTVRSQFCSTPWSECHRLSTIAFECQPPDLVLMPTASQREQPTTHCL